MGKFLIVVGFFVIVTGILIQSKVEIPGWIGSLPGDICIKKGNVTLYFPVATSLLASLVLSFILFLLFGSKK